MTKLEKIQTFNCRAAVYRELSSMPPLSHWEDRSRPFEREQSPVLQFIVSRQGCDFKEAERIFYQARKMELVVFDADKKVWLGTRKELPH